MGFGDGNFEVHEDVTGPAPTVIKVLGCGGAGTNAVNWMIESGLSGVNFYAANTDVQSLNGSRAQHLPIGAKLTGGLGAGSDPNIGEQAAMADRQMIENAVSGANMLFVTAGMGGGTGTGAAPVVAQIARECGILTVGVVTKPFGFEGKHKMEVAEKGLLRMKEAVDTLIVIPNQQLLNLGDKKLGYKAAFHMADDVLRNAVQSITDVINRAGFINVDFNDVKAALKDQGKAIMGIGLGKGEKRATEAAEKALSNPLLEETDIKGAKNVLINITCGEELAISETNDIVQAVTDQADSEALIKFGIVDDPSMEDRVQVTVIATGFGAPKQAVAPQKKGDGLFTSDVVGADEWGRLISGGLTGSRPRPQPHGEPDTLRQGGGQERVSPLPPRGYLRENLEEPSVYRMRRLTLYDSEGRELAQRAVG